MSTVPNLVLSPPLRFLFLTRSCTGASFVWYALMDEAPKTCEYPKAVALLPAGRRSFCCPRSPISRCGNTIFSSTPIVHNNLALVLCESGRSPCRSLLKDTM